MVRADTGATQDCPNTIYDFYGGEICTSVGTRYNIHVLQYVDLILNERQIDTQGAMIWPIHVYLEYRQWHTASFIEYWTHMLYHMYVVQNADAHANLSSIEILWYLGAQEVLEHRNCSYHRSFWVPIDPHAHWVSIRHSLSISIHMPIAHAVSQVCCVQSADAHHANLSSINEILWYLLGKNCSSVGTHQTCTVLSDYFQNLKVFSFNS
jgi:hypothetical protein